MFGHPCAKRTLACPGSTQGAKQQGEPSPRCHLQPTQLLAGTEIEPAPLKSRASDGPWLFASLAIGRGARGDRPQCCCPSPHMRTPALAPSPVCRGPRCLVCPCPHGVTMASGWLDSSEHHCSICHWQGGERPHLWIDIPWPEVKSSHRSEQGKLQPWCNTTQRLEAMGSAAQQDGAQTWQVIKPPA